MKKVIALFLCLLIIVSMSACAGNSEAQQNSQTETENSSETTAPEKSEVPVETEAKIPMEKEEPEATEEPVPAVNWTLDTVPVPDELKEFPGSQGDNYIEYVNRNVGYDVLKSYENLLTEKGFTIVQDTLEPNLYAATATQNNTTVRIYYETADWDLTDPEFLANGGAGLDTSIFSIVIEIEQ